MSWAALGGALAGAAGAWWLVGPTHPLAPVLGAMLGVTAGLVPRAPTDTIARRTLATLRSALVAAACLTLAALALAAGSVPEPVPDPAFATASYDLDARIPTRALPECSARVRGSTRLLDRGARPRLDPTGRYVWFDAEHEGRRQVERLDRRSGAVRCWSCGEPGHNQRPAPGRAAVVFETTRHARWWDPGNTELRLASPRGEAPSATSRRLTRAAGPDDHALLVPGAGVVVWSRRRGGRHEVVSAPLRGGHGDVRLGEPTPRRVAAAWVAPLAWAPDARSLVVSEGNPLGRSRARRIDPASGASWPFGRGLRGVSFGRDGGTRAQVSARESPRLGRLPEALGGLLAPVAARLERGGALGRGTRLWIGPTAAEPVAVDLGEIGGWGAPTGVALVPGETALVLGQQRRVDGAQQERLLELRLDCRAPF